MKRVLTAAALAAALAFGFGGAAQAASPDEIAATAQVDYAKKGGKHGWKHHGRGKHYGWHRGRGHHYGWYKPRRPYGYYRPHGVYAYPRYRSYGYAPAYRFRGPYVTGSTRASVGYTTRASTRAGKSITAGECARRPE